MKTVMRKTGPILAAILLFAGIHPLLTAARVGLRPITAVMCELVQQSAPVNQAVVFSIDVGRVACFTEFDQVSRPTIVLHKWYRKDHLIAVKRLSVTSGRRYSFSSMQLRDADKGPWRVEVTDAEANLLTTLRFSITD